MKSKKILLVVLILLLAVTLTACGDKAEPTPAPAPTADNSGGEAVSADVQALLDIAIPNLESKLEEGKVTKEIMDDIISQIKNGDISNKIQLMTKMAPYL